MTTQARTMKGIKAVADETNWEAVYREYLPRVYNFFLYRVEDKPLAEDMTAAVFEKAWRGRKRYESDLGAFSTWLFTIARNVAADHFRRDRHDLPLETLLEQADPASLPEEIVQRRHNFAKLKRLLSQFPERECDLVAFKFGADLTNREIARLMRLSESNVGSILHRVIEKLRVEFGENHE
jgi:RNA polymerase sigma-70 factor, ECF subfamily